MFQLINWVADTCLKFGDKYGMATIIGIFALAVVGFVVRAVRKVMDRNGPKQDV